MGIIDWGIVVIFFFIIAAIGLFFSRKNKDNNDYFLGNRKMPVFVVALSAVGASVSAGTFVGAPQISFATNLTYIILSVSGIFGGLLAAFIILPTLYKANTITVYGYLEKRFGKDSKIATSIFFLLGQLLTAGSRLFIAAIAISVMLFNDIQFNDLMISILILGLFSTFFTMGGGIKGVIYIDSLEITLTVVAGIVVIILLYNSIPASLADIVGRLRHAPIGNGSEINKLTVINPEFSLTSPYTLISALIGGTIFKFAQYSTDQEFVQRQLTTKSVKKATSSLIYAQLLSLPVVIIFLLIGLLLFIFYSSPQLMGAASPHDIVSDSRQIFPQYIFNHTPNGVRGLMMVGLLGAALSSFNSSINGMASSLVSDIYAPWKEKRNKKKMIKTDQLKDSRMLAFVIGLALTVFAILSAIMQSAGEQSLVDFALGIMSFSYAGMLGVFLCAVLTKRGNSRSVITALVSGGVVVLLLQPYILDLWSNTLLGARIELAWPWWTVIGGGVSFCVCLIGTDKK